MQKLLIPILLASIICGGFIASDTQSGRDLIFERQESELFDDNYQIIVRSNPIFPETEVLGTHHDSYYSLLARYDWDANLMYRIMKAESSGNPNAINHNDRHRTCNGSYGLMQLSCQHLSDYGIWHNWNNPEENIRVAYEVYKRQGIRAWGAYTNGSYLTIK